MHHRFLFLPSSGQFFLWHSRHRVQRASWPLPLNRLRPECHQPFRTQLSEVGFPALRELGFARRPRLPLGSRSFDRCPPLCCRPFHRSFSNAYDLPSQKTQAEQQLRTRTSIGTGTETTRRQTNEVEFQGRISHVDSSNNGAMKVNGCQCFAIVPLANVK